MRKINRIVIHCADTPNGRDFTIKDIDQWHRKRGFVRNGIVRKHFNPDLFSVGYHYVINIDGTISTGRSDAEIGAHAKGYNHDSIGICIIGKNKFTKEQWDSLASLVARLIQKYSVKLEDVIGHNTVSPSKTCPNFNVQHWACAKNEMEPFKENVL